jgi:hypothetical protein
MISSFLRWYRSGNIPSLATLAITGVFFRLRYSSAFIRDASAGDYNSRGLFRNTRSNRDIELPHLRSSPIDHSFMALDLYESSSSSLSAVSRESMSVVPVKAYNHTLAILTFPSTFKGP